jgi:tRNA(adenine34) deaminase
MKSDFLPGSDEYFMLMALQEAESAFEADEVPVGAIVVMNQRIIARGHNQVETLNDPTAHAEIIALTSAFNFLGSKYLPNATLFVTLEPCHMCSGALFWSKIGRVVYGASDEKHGYRHFCGQSNPFHPKTELTRGVLEQDCAGIVQAFFRSKR